MTTDPPARATPAVAVIVASAGRGERMGGDVRKPYLMLAGKPILLRTLEKFSGLPGLTQLILAVHPDDADDIRQGWADWLAGLFKCWRVVAGGQTRTHTIRNALAAVEFEADQVILVHDGVRPFVRRPVIEAVAQAAFETGAAIAATPAVATIKRVDEYKVIVETPPRERLWMAQTPQGFRREVILEAYERASEQSVSATDDSALVERLNRPVLVVEDRRDNIKITTPEDMAIAEAILRVEQGAGG